MAQTGFFHHIGSFLLFAATVLLIITCISAPVVNDIGLMKVDLGNQNANDHAYVVFGMWGYCTKNVDGDGFQCSPTKLGYSPADVMHKVEGTDFSDYAKSTTDSLTKAMILHPIACAANFIAFMLGLGAGFVGSFLASVVALVAFLITCVVLIIDFVLFSIVRSNISDDGQGSDAHYSTAAWTILVSGICSLLGTILLFLTCCSGRMHRRRTTTVDKAELGYAPRRRRWF
ncbi:pali-domain-containing protein [Thozetella sp. PMI_491]|nr:pali-domain-containing protein [Thozetella sp. PMI_491]